MEKTPRLYPSAPLEYKYVDLKRRLEKKLNYVNRFNNSDNTIKANITYLKNENRKSKKKFKNCNTLTSILESVDTVVFISSTTTSVTLSVTGIDLIITSISAGNACSLSLAIKVLDRIKKNRYNVCLKQYEKHQQTIKSSVELYRKSLQDNVIDKMQVNLF